MPIPQVVSFHAGLNDHSGTARAFPEFPRHHWSLIKLGFDSSQLDHVFGLLGRLLQFFTQAFPGWPMKQDPYPPVYTDIEMWYDEDGNLIAIFRHTYKCGVVSLQPSHYMAFARGTLIATGTFFNCNFNHLTELANPDRWTWDMLGVLLQAGVEYADKAGKGYIDFFGMEPDSSPHSDLCATLPNNTAFWKMKS